MKKFAVLPLLLLILSGGYVHSAEKKKTPDTSTAVIYAEDHAFMIAAPAGWVLDSRAGLANNLNAVLYPEGSGFETSPVVMYIATTLKDTTYGTLEKVMQYDADRFRKGHPDIKIENAKPLKTGDKKKVVVKYFSGDTYGNYDAIGYLDERKMVIFFVLSSRKDKDAYAKGLKPFRELIASYKWLADEVKFKK